MKNKDEGEGEGGGRGGGLINFPPLKRRGLRGGLKDLRCPSVVLDRAIGESGTYYL